MHKKLTQFTGELRCNVEWANALLGEGVMEQFIRGNESLSELLNYSKVRQVNQKDQQKLI